MKEEQSERGTLAKEWVGWEGMEEGMGGGGGGGGGERWATFAV